MVNGGLNDTKKFVFSEVTNGVFLWAAGNRPLLNNVERDDGVWELAVRNNVGDGKSFWFGGVDYRVGFCYHRLDNNVGQSDSSRHDGILTGGRGFLHLGGSGSAEVTVNV